MELHHVGKHCALAECNRLDFLPLACPNCSKDFCDQHCKPELHNCSAPPPIVDVKVPICPVCNGPVPVARGQDPNIKVNEHIANGCASASQPASQANNICNSSNCKTKLTLVSQECGECQKRYCLKHRFTEDHQCPGPPPPVAIASASKIAANLRSKFMPHTDKPTSSKSPTKNKKDKCVIS